MKVRQSSLVEFFNVPVVTLKDIKQDPKIEFNCYCCTKSRYCSKFQDFLVLREKLKGMKQLALDSNIIKAKEDYKHLLRELKKVRSLIWKCTKRRTFLFGLGYKTFRIGDIDARRCRS